MERPFLRKESCDVWTKLQAKSKSISHIWNSNTDLYMHQVDHKHVSRKVTYFLSIDERDTCTLVCLHWIQPCNYLVNSLISKPLSQLCSTGWPSPPRKSHMAVAAASQAHTHTQLTVIVQRKIRLPAMLPRSSERERDHKNTTRRPSLSFTHSFRE